MKHVRLGDAIELAYGKNLPEAHRASGSIPVYGSNGIVGWHNHALVSAPTIVVGRKGAAGAIHLSEGPCFPIDTTYYVRIRDGFEFDLRFLAHALRWIDLSRLRIVVAVPGINREHVYRERLPYPPIDEQRLIVDLLSRAENIVRMRREAEAKAKEIIPALFVDMFGDSGTNPRGWEVQELGGHVVLLTGYPFKSGEFVDAKDAVRLCRGANVLPQEVDWSDVRHWPQERLSEFGGYSLECGDIVLAMDRPWISTGLKVARIAASDLPALLVQRAARTT